MPGETAIALLVAYAVVTVGLRGYVHWRRTGSSGFARLSGRRGSVEWWAGAIVVAAFVLAPLALILDVTGLLPRVAIAARREVATVGLAMFLAGFAATFGAQMAMGASWRVGVRKEEVTALVTRGPFAIVRNPIFSAMLLATLGLALMVPNVLNIIAWLAALAGLELHVRVVEEPHLRRVHGASYASYACRVGRFVPGLGKLRAN